jgi:hypothetical protein
VARAAVAGATVAATRHFHDPVRIGVADGARICEITERRALPVQHVPGEGKFRGADCPIMTGRW